MPSTVKQNIKEEYNRLKRAFEKLVNPKKEKASPQFALQPYRNKKLF